MEAEREEQHLSDDEEQNQEEDEVELQQHEHMLDHVGRVRQEEGEGENESDLDHSSQTVLAQAVLSPLIAAATNAANAARHHAVIAAGETALADAADNLRRYTALHYGDDDDDEYDVDDYFLEGVSFHRGDDGDAGDTFGSIDLDVDGSVSGHGHSLDSIHSQEDVNSDNHNTDRGSDNNNNEELFQKMETFLCEFQTLTSFYHTLMRLEKGGGSDAEHDDDDCANNDIGGVFKDKDLAFVRLLLESNDEEETKGVELSTALTKNYKHGNIDSNNGKKNASNGIEKLCNSGDQVAGDKEGSFEGRCITRCETHNIMNHDVVVERSAGSPAGFERGLKAIKFSESDNMDTTAHTNDSENKNAQVSPPPRPPSLSLEQLVNILFRPGMKYCGKIQIPGLGQARGEVATDNTTIEEGNNDYELIIEWNRKDALGNQYLSARHHAYDDEQYVHLNVVIKSGGNVSSSEMGNDDIEHDTIHIEYADGETVCKGFWNPRRFRLEGKVYQMMQANNKVYYSNAVSHVFTLYPCTANHRRGWGNCRRQRWRIDDTNDPTHTPKWRETMMQDLLSIDTRAIVAHRHRTINMQMDLLLQFDDVDKAMDLDPVDKRKMRLLLHSDAVPSPSASPTDRGVRIFHFFRRLRDMEWGLLISGTSLWGEYTCAEFRRRAALYDDTTFETRERKEEIIKKWKEAGMDLSGAHELWNKWETAVKRVGLSQVFWTSSHSISSMMYPFHVMSTRLYGNYDFLEHSYRRAEGRLPRGDLVKFEIGSPFITSDGYDGDVTMGQEGASCAICQESLFREEPDEERHGTAMDDDTENLYKLSCSHCFHGQCLRNWLHDNSSCPVCRFDLAG
ncbi:hypothetical protein ACHAXS_008395 [Conticribra weissflogii]